MYKFLRNFLQSPMRVNVILQITTRHFHPSPALKLPNEEERTKTNCTLIPGDGVGPELINALETVFKAADVPIEFDMYLLSEANPVPNIKFEDVTRSISTNKLCIKGTLDRSDMSIKDDLRSMSMRMLIDLDLYAHVVHIKSLPGIKSRHKDIDTIIIRESTEGEYSALEHESVPGVIECLKIITSEKSKRIAKFAFDFATRNHRKKVTAVHKANIMKLGDGLFLRSCEQMSQLYPRIKFEKMIVDNTTMQLVANPKQFDVMVTPNLYGNIVNNLAAGLVGGAGVVAGVSYSPEVAVFEPGARHTYAKATGKNIANPTAMLLCGVKLLQHVNLHDHAKTIFGALEKSLKDGKLTKDVGGNCSTVDFVESVVQNLG